MPLYDYKCPHCGATLEVFVRAVASKASPCDDLVDCLEEVPPRCENDDYKMERQISAHAKTPNKWKV